ncbi:hypothetical protein, conserved, partial [Babesia bigemina]
KTLDP